MEFQRGSNLWNQEQRGVLCHERNSQSPLSSNFRYFLLMCWLLVFILSTIITTMYSLIWGNCKFVSGQENIDFYQFHFLFPSGSQRDNLMILGGHDKDLFCQGYIQRGEIMFLASSASSFLVLMSLVHFLMSMSANYANIRGQDKFTELRVILFYPRT